MITHSTILMVHTNLEEVLHDCFPRKWRRDLKSEVILKSRNKARFLSESEIKSEAEGFIDRRLYGEPEHLADIQAREQGKAEGWAQKLEEARIGLHLLLRNLLEEDSFKPSVPITKSIGAQLRDEIELRPTSVFFGSVQSVRLPILNSVEGARGFVDQITKHLRVRIQSMESLGLSGELCERWAEPSGVLRNFSPASFPKYHNHQEVVDKRPI
jgi:hypothetical protein